jgi:myo-inositol-1(or 4)-monophosphatase
MDTARLLSLAEEAARSAGHLLLARAAPLTAVLSEDGRDIKLAADRAAEAAILEALVPTGLPVLSEESGLLRGGRAEALPHATDRRTEVLPYATDRRAEALPHARPHDAWGGLPGGWCWIVDPLDGTFNYLRGMRPWGVSIALWHDAEPVAGVVFDPVSDECFSGRVGHGATLNGAAVAVAPSRPASKAVVATGAPVHADYTDAGLVTVRDAMRRFKKVRMIGSAALSAAFVACGRLDAYVEEGIMLWDIAAGAALVRAAGGVADVRPSPLKPWATITRLAASPAVWEDDAR